MGNDNADTKRRAADRERAWEEGRKKEAGPARKRASSVSHHFSRGKYLYSTSYSNSRGDSLFEKTNKCVSKNKIKI